MAKECIWGQDLSMGRHILIYNQSPTKSPPCHLYPAALGLLFVTLNYFALGDMLLVIFSRHFMCVFVSLARL